MEYMTKLNIRTREKTKLMLPDFQEDCKKAKNVNFCLKCDKALCFVYYMKIMKNIKIHIIICRKVFRSLGIKEIL